MGDFKLDTSGVVHCPWPGQKAWNPAHGPDGPGHTWDGLSPFVQGYVEALFASGQHGWALKPGRNGIHAALSDLAPETLARIIEDCHRATMDAGGEALSAEDGEAFWADRQRGSWATRYPPLTLSLGDDGKIHLTNASQSEGAQS